MKRIVKDLEAQQIVRQKKHEQDTGEELYIINHILCKHGVGTWNEIDEMNINEVEICMTLIQDDIQQKETPTNK